MPIVPIPGGPGSPFRLNSLPHHAFVHAEWARVKQHALTSIAGREHLLLLGLPGTGKSLLLRYLNQTLKEQGVSVRLLRSDDPLEDLDCDDVLLIDEAELLSAAKCEQILRLPNALVMAGLPNLPERIPACPDTFHCVTFEPLPPDDVARFVIARLLENGCPRDTFTPEALVALVLRSGGLLRLVIILAGAAMFFAGQRGAAKVTADDVIDAEAMRAFLPEEVDQPTTLSKVVDTELTSDTAVLQAPDSGPPWLEPVVRTTRQWNKAAGLSAFVCASLAVIGVAVVTASGFKSEPTLPIQEVQGRSMPRMVEPAAPDLALLPKTPLARSIPVQMATASPPIYVETAAAPALALTPRTEPYFAAAPKWYDTSATVETKTLPAPPLVVSSLTKTEDVNLTFTGPILNNTMGQAGQLTLAMRLRDAQGSIAAVFQASQGLIGSGILTGDIDRNGQISLSGRLMMGRNPFDCVLEARLEGEHLVGEATFVRSTSGAAAHSSFKLYRL